MTLTGSQVQGDLGLRSTWFDVAWLSLTPPAAPGPDRRHARALGNGARHDRVTLQSRVAGGTWHLVGAVSPDSSGAFTVEVSPRGETWYRLASGAARGALIRVDTGGVVTASVATDVITGAVSSRAAGAPIFLDRKDGKGWVTVATARAGTDGTFAFRPLPTPGTYRVRCTPGHGLPAGATSALTITQ